MAQAKTTRKRRAKFAHYVAYFLGIATLLLILVAVPFALSSIAKALFQRSADRVYAISSGTPTTNSRSHTHLDIDLISLDEWQHTATMLVSGNYVCASGCNWGSRYIIRQKATSS